MKEGGEQMPRIFKSLATIAAWILFVVGCLGILIPAVTRIVTGEVIGSLIAWGIGIVALTLSVVVMKLRQTLE
jgi:Co/Zn/Cd efflux system component